MSSKRCSASGKRKYKTLKAARSVLAEFQRRRDHSVRQVPLDTYRCGACRKWHLTSRLG